MIIHPSNEAVGEWTLWIADGAAHREADFALLEACCEVLTREGLLRPEWLVLDPLGRAERVPWQRVDLTGIDDVTVEGTGWTLDAFGEGLASPHVMLVRFDTRLGFVTLSTWSDAWLPADLAGVPQPEVHARNAPRLAAALRELTRRTGWRLSLGPSAWTIGRDDGLALEGKGNVTAFLRPWPPAEGRGADTARQPPPVTSARREDPRS